MSDTLPESLVDTKLVLQDYGDELSTATFSNIFLIWFSFVSLLVHQLSEAREKLWMVVWLIYYNQWQKCVDALLDDRTNQRWFSEENI